MLSFLSPEVREALQMAFSLGSLVVTAYFWFVRVNRERVSIGLYPVSGFEGALERPDTGVWTGQIFLTNRSILPTAVVAGKTELFWKGNWILGNLIAGTGSDLPWNLPPTQAFAKTVTLVFDVGPQTSADALYVDQRVRIAFLTVEGKQVVGEFRTHSVGRLAAK